MGDKPEEYLKDLFKSDKSCEIDKTGESIEKENGECFMNNIQALDPIAEYIGEDDKVLPKWVSLCQIMDNMMRACFFENTCISKQEMMMVKNIAFRIYRMAMDAV